jgi:hypothetical protein
MISPKIIELPDGRQQPQTINHKPQTVLAVELYFRNFAAVS